MASPAPPPPERSRNWADLPAELTSSILIRLGAVEVLMSARKVCKSWRQICSDPKMWRVVEIKHSDYEESPQILKHVVTKAVDLSCGQLVHLDLQIKGHPPNWFRYIFDRSSRLRRLYLSSSANFTRKMMSKMLERLSLLEELHLDCRCNFKEAIEIAGRCCPQLKSLKLINAGYLCPKMGCDEDALAIAENIPGLRHLQLSGPNKITCDGLLAILENCPHLESLDVCLNVANVGPDLVRRLFLQIKDLKLSYCRKHNDVDLDYVDFLNNTDFLYEDDPFELSDIRALDEDASSGLSDIITISDD